MNIANVLDSIWIKTNSGKYIGIVAVDCGPREENWQCYMAAVDVPDDQHDDELYVIANGIHLADSTMAYALFPNLDAGGYI